MIFVDTNILYHIIHKTSRMDEALTVLEESPGDYVIDMVVHNEIIYASTMHYLEHGHGYSSVPGRSLVNYSLGRGIGLDIMDDEGRVVIDASVAIDLFAGRDETRVEVAEKIFMCLRPEMAM